MKILTKIEICNLLLSLNIKQGMNLFIQSDLGLLGKIDGGIRGLLDNIISVVGPKSTLIFPSYTFNISDFDVVNAKPSVEIGSFTRYLWSNKIGKRTLHPIHSHIVIGHKESIYTSQEKNYSFGVNSIFNEMDKDNFYWLVIGTTIEHVSTYFHHIEALFGVPYREWISLDRKVIDYNNRKKIFRAEYYSRILESENVYNFKMIYDNLISKGIIIKKNKFEIANFKNIRTNLIFAF